MTSGSRCTRPSPRRQRGFGYLMVLFAMAAMGITLAGAGEVWHTTARREKEAQLLFVGHQFRQALASYRDRSPVGSPTAPATLGELLEDDRFPTPVRHLRRLWRDPMTNATDWVLLKPGGRITAIHSRERGEPLRKVFNPRDAAFNGTASYDQWVFEALAPEPVPAINTNNGVTP